MKNPRIGASLALLVIVTGFSLAVSAKPLTLRMATDSGAKGSPAGDALDLWAAQIEERSKGTPDEMAVEVFYQEELGGQQEVFDLLIVGEVDMMLNWPKTSYDKRMGLRNTPYMFFTWEQAFDAYKPDGWVSDIYSDIHADLGLKYFAAWPEGFSGVATRDRYATTIEGARGIKVRVPSNFPNPQTMQALGYSATAIAWGEVYTSLQTGVVDGEAGNTIYWDYEYFRDVVDYYVRTRHTFTTGVLSMNMDTWNGLSDSQQEIVSEAAAAVSEKQFKDARELDQYYVDQAVDAGIEYIEPTDAELRKLANAAREEVWPLLEEELGPVIVERLRKNAPDGS